MLSGESFNPILGRQEFFNLNPLYLSTTELENDNNDFIICFPSLTVGTDLFEAFPTGTIYLDQRGNRKALYKPGFDLKGDNFNPTHRFPEKLQESCVFGYFAPTEGCDDMEARRQ